MPADEPDAEVQQAVVRLLKATEEYTRAYGHWSVDPHRWRELHEAEKRLDEARRQATAATPVRFDVLDED